MPPSSVAARSLALAVIGVGAASFAAHGQNVTAFNPYSGAGLPGGPLPQYAAPPVAAAADTVRPAPVAGPAFNPWASRNPALASPPAVPSQASAPARQTTARTALPPPPPGRLKSRVVAVPELPTSRSRSRDAQKAAAAAPAEKSASTPPAPASVAPPAPPPAAMAAASPPVPTLAPPTAVRPPPTTAPTPPATAAPPPRPPAPQQQQMAAVAPVPSAPVRSSVSVTLVFGARSTELSDSSRVDLDRLAKELADRTLRQVELRSVSENGDPDGRKISLARALIVRNYLIDKGVRSKIEIASIVGGGGERVEILVPGT
ncbi:MAG: OmpA family protein [Reyranella sp.]